MRRTLAEWPASPTPAQRRRLAALLAASGDHNSALVQWWRLDPAERIADDNVTALLAAQFAAYDTRRNENHLIAARLAARLGLDRVFAVDDQSDDAQPVGSRALDDHVGSVAEFVSRLPHPSPGMGRHDAVAAESVGHRRRGDPGQPSDVVDRRSSALRRHPVRLVVSSLRPNHFGD